VESKDSIANCIAIFETKQDGNSLKKRKHLQTLKSRTIGTIENQN